MDSEARNPRRDVFVLASTAWISCVFLLFWYEQTELAAAVVGGGPFALYQLHQEYVRSPVLRTTRGGAVRYGYQIAVSEFRETTAVYPYIKAYVLVENVGKSTAKQCFAQTTDGDEYFKTRWGGETANRDIHPNQTEFLDIMRFVPSPDNVNGVIKTGGRVVEFNCPDQFDMQLSEGTIEIHGLEYHVQTPVSEDREKVLEEHDDVDPPGYYRGQHIDPRDEYGLSIEFGAEDWNGNLSIDPVSVQKAVEDGEWLGPDNDLISAVQKELQQYNW